MNDSERNSIVLRIATKIQQDGTPYDEQNQSVLEQYIKHAIEAIRFTLQPSSRCKRT